MGSEMCIRDRSPDDSAGHGAQAVPDDDGIPGSYVKRKRTKRVRQPFTPAAYTQRKVKSAKKKRTQKGSLKPSAAPAALSPERDLAAEDVEEGLQSLIHTARAKISSGEATTEDVEQLLRDSVAMTTEAMSVKRLQSGTPGVIKPSKSAKLAPKRLSLIHI